MFLMLNLQKLFWVLCTYGMLESVNKHGCQNAKLLLPPRVIAMAAYYTSVDPLFLIILN